MAKKTFPLVLELEDIEFLREIARENDVSASKAARWIFALQRGVSFSPTARFAERFIKESSDKSSEMQPA